MQFHESLGLTILLVAVACTPIRPAPAPVPADGPDPQRAAPALPPVPFVDLALSPRVVYPPSGATIQARDSNFIFGSVGSGRALLAINGHPVRVLPNGSWLAFLPVPSTTAPRYDIVAVRDADTVRISHPVRLAAPIIPLPAAGRLMVDTASARPRGTILSLRNDEDVRVSIRAPRNATVWVALDGGVRRQLYDVGTAARSGDTTNAATTWAADVPARLMRSAATIVAARAGDTVRVSLSTAAAPSAERQWVLLGDEATVGDSDRVVIARPTPDGSYRWFLLPGTQLEATGRRGEFVRIRMDDDLEAWVSATDVRPLPQGWPAPTRVIRNARMVQRDEWVELVLGAADRPAHSVEYDGRTLSLVLHGTRADIEILPQMVPGDFVRQVRWVQERDDRVRFIVELNRPAHGWFVLWRAGSLVLRLRPPPEVAVDSPLRGLLIAVDAGHPPAGSTGPTGLYEAVPALQISQRLQRMLEERGATVLMTRTTAAAVPLGDRPIMARRANAHAFVSIHMNALPDGVNPSTAHGTSTLYYHPHSAPLAREVQDRMLRHMGLRDLGIHYQNLAVARVTWMPSVLCEGAFIMIPEQEAALRTAEFQEAYALGVLEGLERYFRALATEPR